MSRAEVKSVEIIMAQLECRKGILTATEAADLVKSSKRTVRHHFKRAGTNFRTARLRAKLAVGASLLRATKLGIPEISAHLGYSDRTKFEKIFKRIYGVTPSEYRSNRKPALAENNR